MMDIRILTLGLPILISIIGVIISITSAIRSKKEFELTTMEKLATKVFVEDKIKTVNEKIEENKKENEKEHSNLKEGYKTEFGYIKEMLFDIKEDLKFLKQKKAS